MSKVVVMPKLGLTMTEGEVTKWYKSEGEVVHSGEALFEVATDKLTNDVEATENGVLRKIFMAEGESVACLEPVAIIAEDNEDISSLLSESNHETVSAPTTMELVAEKKITEQPIDNGRIKASPIAKKFAAENNINLSLVTGTGPNGRIVLEDVETCINSALPKVKASPVAEIVAAEHRIDLAEIKKETRIMKDDVLNLLQEKKAVIKANPAETRVPMTQMRKVIANRMSESWRISPAVTFDIKVDVTRLQEIRNRLQDIHKVTFTDLLVKVVAVTLIEFPYVNSSIENNEIILRNDANIGVAVALEGGLVVPVVKYANTKGLKQISSEVKELAEKARNNELTPDQYTGGTFTITNLGMYGIEAFSPIINQPEVAILGVNTITETPVVVNGEIVIKPIMNLSLTADHRVVDGAVAAQFLARLKQYIEKPEILLL